MQSFSDPDLDHLARCPEADGIAGTRLVHFVRSQMTKCLHVDHVGIIHTDIQCRNGRVYTLDIFQSSDRIDRSLDQPVFVTGAEQVDRHIAEVDLCCRKVDHKRYHTDSRHNDQRFRQLGIGQIAEQFREGARHRCQRCSLR